MLSIRLRAPEEREAVIELIVQAFEPITMFRRIEELFGPLNQRHWRDRFRSKARAAVDGKTTLVGLDDAVEGSGRLVACAVCEYDPEFRLAFLDLLAVSAECQGRGYGQQLLRAFEAWATEQGAETAHLDCLIDNDAGNRLYQGEGFQEVARQIIWFKRLAPKG